MFGEAWPPMSVPDLAPDDDDDDHSDTPLGEIVNFSWHPSKRDTLKIMQRVVNIFHKIVDLYSCSAF